ncbi:MAG: transposase, partial [Blautia sp.]|nr:transposase [Blautia sp.]
VTNSGLKYDEEDEVVNVCQAIQEIRQEERKIGELNKAKEDAKNFYKLGVEVEKIAQGVGYAVETVKGWLGLES